MDAAGSRFARLTKRCRGEMPGALDDDPFTITLAVAAGKEINVARLMKRGAVE